MINGEAKLWVGVIAALVAGVGGGSLSYGNANDAKGNANGRLMVLEAQVVEQKAATREHTVAIKELTEKVTRLVTLMEHHEP